MFANVKFVLAAFTAEGAGVDAACVEPVGRLEEGLDDEGTGEEGREDGSAGKERESRSEVEAETGF